MSDPRVIYIAGPYRSPTRRGLRRNIRRAQQAAAVLWLSGHVPVCPHTYTWPYKDLLPESTWLPRLIALMLKCDGVLLLGGWTHSEGTRAEVRAALSHNLPVYNCPHAAAVTRLTVSPEYLEECMRQYELLNPPLPR